jgi:flavin reductase (DIM6/NTAB) family NADH-FMN oxidoreductase RutF
MMDLQGCLPMEPAEMPSDISSERPAKADDLRLAMRKWPSGVSVVTVRHLGVSHGMTVGSLVSVSLDPPAVLVSLERGTRTHELIQAAGIFAVTILSADQRLVSERFASSGTEAEDRFAGLETHNLVTGAPLLAGGLAFLDCRVVAAHPSGMNTLFIGEVLAARSGREGGPLLYFDRQYRQLQD